MSEFDDDDNEQQEEEYQKRPSVSDCGYCKKLGWTQKIKWRENARGKKYPVELDDSTHFHRNASGKRASDDEVFSVTGKRPWKPKAPQYSSTETQQSPRNIPSSGSNDREVMEIIEVQDYENLRDKMMDGWKYRTVIACSRRNPATGELDQAIVPTYILVKYE